MSKRVNCSINPVSSHKDLSWWAAKLGNAPPQLPQDRFDLSTQATTLNPAVLEDHLISADNDMVNLLDCIYNAGKDAHTKSQQSS